MEEWIFTRDDLRRMAVLGISEKQLRDQIILFQEASGYLRLLRPCILGDGIERIPASETSDLILLQEKASQEGRFLKFIPASGAATRMFQGLLPFFLNSDSQDSPTRPLSLHENDPGEEEIKKFFSDLKRFPFWKELKETMHRTGVTLTDFPQQNQWPEVLDFLLTKRGLNYLNRPKGLHLFHTYSSHIRTALEEHLIEAIRSISDQQGRCRLHVTISPEHEDTFRDFFNALLPVYESRTQYRLMISFSFQYHSTNTLAVDLTNRPFRDDSGNLLFRPGGHGALLRNLNDLQGDLIYIKNIDNVQPDRLKETTIFWKKILGGYLVQLQNRIHHYLRILTEGKDTAGLFSEAIDFCQHQLGIYISPDLRSHSFPYQKKWLIETLNRPIRVCGMVRNEGEPGGGPFWVEGRDGTSSKQIVESAQINPASEEQKALWASSTHFNPVDLVCAVRDFRGRPFDLHRYADPQAVFISRKSHQGRELKALEVPGLWNGAMAEWISSFVEVPIETFSPVKRIIDLLRPEHQP
jgi:hypothetical protein